VTPHGGGRESNSPDHHSRHLWANPLFVCARMRLKRRAGAVSIVSYRCGILSRKHSRGSGRLRRGRRSSFAVRRSTWLRVVKVERTRARTLSRRVGTATREGIEGKGRRRRRSGERFGGPGCAEEFVPRRAAAVQSRRCALGASVSTPHSSRELNGEMDRSKAHLPQSCASSRATSPP
jgi:hypothetical protein